MKRAIGFAVLFAAGCAAALSLNVSRAQAWSPNDLPPGFRVTHTLVGPGTGPCGEYYQFTAPVVSNPYCTDSPTFQADFDAWVNAHYTPPATTTAPPVVPTTVTVTTPAPPATTTDTTAPPPAPAPPVIVTVTTTATPVEVSLQAQIDALAKQLAALTDRVSRIEKAGDAAWLAFEQAVQGGATIPDAAEQARGTWLDAVYQLGAFAP